ncbi:MAG TPA: DUF1573 domain-containing protein [Patescibacteria group bacterium]
MKSKFLLASIVLILVLGVGGLVYFQQKINQKNTIATPTNQVLGLEANPPNYDLGEILYSKGIVTKEYEIKNTTDKSIRLRKVATSCMCTKAKVKIGDRETRYFGLEAHGNINPVLDGYEIKSGETAVVTMQFDPTAHGPQGVGPIDRQVNLTFSDPVGIKTLTFKGIVVLK